MALFYALEVINEMKTVFIIAGIVLVLVIAFVAYACLIVGSRAEREMFGDDQER